MIRKLVKQDLDRIMQIWLASNLEAHDFVDPDYWKSNLAMVQEQLMQAEVLVYEMNGELQGFIGLVDNYIAGIFVSRNVRSMGIGRQLLEAVKATHQVLTLAVYQKNQRAIDFYQRFGFEISAKRLDEATGEVEYEMDWSRLE
jgi:putative acetyltransferase